MSVLVAGCGSIGRRHIQNALHMNVGRVIAFDVSESQRTIVRKELSICVVEELSQAFHLSPTLVVVATPTDQHIPIALEAVRNGCHLFIEKPISHSLELIDELCAEIDSRGLISMAACNMRFHPGPAMVKRLIDARAIGTILSARIHTGSYLPRWRPQQDYRQSYSASLESGGAVLDCIHELDLALWYFGDAQMVASAALAAETIGLAVDGLSEIILHHHTGILSSVHLNFVQQDYRRSCEIIGSLGTIYWDFVVGKVRVIGPDGALKEQFDQPPQWEINQMYLDELDHFLSCVAERKSTVNPIRSSLASLRIALAARASMQKAAA
jgi:predicted dehydrogenase